MFDLLKHFKLSEKLNETLEELLCTEHYDKLTEKGFHFSTTEDSNSFDARQYIGIGISVGNLISRTNSEGNLWLAEGTATSWLIIAKDEEEAIAKLKALQIVNWADLFPG